MSNQIVMIGVDKIDAHPNNPRKNLGDLSELAVSVKENGIMQNLTVVEGEEGRYTAVIGHRRLAAAKQAGLEAVPCVVAKMDEAKQLEVMMVENMQRSDLTTYEQAEGFQLLLDMSFSVADISKKTGFSESTIRRRTNLLALDKENFKASQARNPRLEDYEKITKIKDEKARNKLLDVIGTNNFDNEYLRLSEAQARAERREELVKICEEHGAVQIKNSAGHHYIGYFRNVKELKSFFEDPLMQITAKMFYVLELYSDGVYLYREQKKASQKAAAQIRQKELEKKQKEFRDEATEINKRMYTLRCGFLQEYVGKAEDLDIILPVIIKECADRWQYKRFFDLARTVGCVFDGEGCTNAEDIYKKQPKRTVLALALTFLDENERQSYISGDLEKAYYNNTYLNKIYWLITRLGYVMSDEEIKLRDGTHEIFTKYKTN